MGEVIDSKPKSKPRYTKNLKKAAPSFTRGFRTEGSYLVADFCFERGSHYVGLKFQGPSKSILLPQSSFKHVQGPFT